MAEHHARALRGSRADPPGRARSEPARRQIYSAALQQFEELLAASCAVGPASRPLPLFYALSQAGRAIVAAYGREPHITAHGLAEDRRVESDDLLHRRVSRVPRKDGTDAFGAVARVTSSGDLKDGAELGALWAALPHAYRVPPESWRSDWRLALDVETGPLASSGNEGLSVLLISMGGNPHVEGLEVFTGGRYPTLPDGTTGGLRGGREIAAGSWLADVAIPDVKDDHDAVLDRVAPQFYGGSQRALIPTLPDEPELLTPLMLWWALLFGLSVTARYHPAPWARALAIEGSKQAVPLEALLERAVERLPAIVYDAIFLNADFE
jgi:hypothetical protein